LSEPNGITRRRFLQAMGLLGISGLAACASRDGDMEEYIFRPCPRGSKGATCSTDASGVAGSQEGSIIWYIDLEHEDIMDDPERSPEFLRIRNHRARILGEIAGVFCQAIHYTKVSLSLAQEEKVGAIALSGFTTDFWHYDPKKLYPVCELVKESGIPVIALCGGHQLLAYMFGGTCGAIRELQPGEKDPADWAPGYYKEVGYLPVTVVQDDPIFAGLGSTPVFFESHYWEVKQLPDDFLLLASTQECEVQIIRHKDCLIYGSQPHPEVHDDQYPDGRTLLTNFFRLAGVTG
jgi:GMP synthase (glutamine-hydrolysing)